LVPQVGDVELPEDVAVPEGAQSEPRAMRTPAALAAVMLAVAPYSQKLANGDHTRVASAAARRWRSARVSATMVRTRMKSWLVPSFSVSMLRIRSLSGGVAPLGLPALGLPWMLGVPPTRARVST
jgi:hypothetical protein